MQGVRLFHFDKPDSFEDATARSVQRRAAFNRRGRRRSARELNPSAEVEVVLDAAEPIIEFGKLAEQFVFHPSQVGILPV